MFRCPRLGLSWSMFRCPRLGLSLSMSRCPRLGLSWSMFRCPLVPVLRTGSLQGEAGKSDGCLEQFFRGSPRARWRVALEFYSRLTRNYFMFVCALFLRAFWLEISFQFKFFICWRESKLRPHAGCFNAFSGQILHGRNLKFHSLDDKLAGPSFPLWWRQFLTIRWCVNALSCFNAAFAAARAIDVCRQFQIFELEAPFLCSNFLAWAVNPWKVHLNSVAWR